ncbi:hypothetical protein, partial [Pseudomonas aeruginosa]
MHSFELENGRIKRN